MKSTVFCGACGNRLFVQHTTNRHGTLYEYFICSGRAAKKNGCIASAVPIALIEKKVLDLYARLVLAPELSQRLKAHLLRELEENLVETTKVRADLQKEQARLKDRSKKLLDGHLNGIIPQELYGDEQKEITRKSASIAERLGSPEADAASLTSNLDVAIELANNCYEAYRRASDSLRRNFNQAFFSHIYVDQDDEVRGEIAEPFQMIFNRAQHLSGQES